MKNEIKRNNEAMCVGKLAPYGVQLSHTTKGGEFYKAYLMVSRFSDTVDMVPLMIPVGQLLDKLLSESKLGDIMVSGQFRSRNVRRDGHNCLDLFLFVECVQSFSVDLIQNGIDNNSANLNGFICKKPISRKTPYGRYITDILIAVNRSDGQSDYIPCIVWGRDIQDTLNQTDVGSSIYVTGRIQSRRYRKKLSETESEERVAYELSVRHVELL